MTRAFYGETPGADVEDTRKSICKSCKAPLIVGLVRIPGSTLKWRNFNATPNERDGLLYLTRHSCAR